MTSRERLPNRRGHELLDFEHGGIRYTVGIGRFADDPHEMAGYLRAIANT